MGVCLHGRHTLECCPIRRKSQGNLADLDKNGLCWKTFKIQWVVLGSIGLESGAVCLRISGYNKGLGS